MYDQIRLYFYLVTKLVPVVYTYLFLKLFLISIYFLNFTWFTINVFEKKLLYVIANNISTIMLQHDNLIDKYLIKSII